MLSSVARHISIYPECCREKCPIVVVLITVVVLIAVVVLIVVVEELCFGGTSIR